MYKRLLVMICCLLLSCYHVAEANKTKPVEPVTAKPTTVQVKKTVVPPATQKPPMETPAKPIISNTSGPAAFGPPVPPKTTLKHGGFQDLGILIRTPGAGQKCYVQEPMAVAYRITAENAGPGVVDFSLIHSETLTPVARQTHRYAPVKKQDRFQPTSLEQRFSWLLPNVANGTYYLLATLGSIVGSSHEFEISHRPVVSVTDGRTKGPGMTSSAITIQRPSAGETLNIGNTYDIHWTMPDPMSAFVCGSSAALHLVRVSDNREWVINSRLETTPGLNTSTWAFNYADLGLGRYRIKVVSDAGCTAQSGVFNLTGCDYALESVRFSDGRPLDTGISADTGRYVTGAFSVAVRWNGVRLPSLFAPGTPLGNNLRVRSTITGNYINDPLSGVNFNYGSAGAGGLITVQLPFRFERDAIAHMATSNRRIPLEFSFHPTGASVDMNEANNTLRAEMRITGASESNMEIGAVLSDFDLRRRPSAAPITEYRFTQRFRIKNLSRDDAGGPPAPKNVTVRWEIQYIQPGRIEWTMIQGGNMTVSNVGGSEWKYATCSGSFSHSLPDDIPEGRRFRLWLHADPRNELIDPDRGNNVVSVNFRIVD